MSYAARVVRVLISCPGDVEKYRDVATQVIHEWNARNSETANVVLLPVAWLTHLAPGSGASAQELINKAIVDTSDLLVGIFWTRFGTATDKYGSGTEEEIEKFWSAGRQVMLYFSDETVAPSKSAQRENRSQYKKLELFRKRAYARGLVSGTMGTEDFRSKFEAHLQLKRHEFTQHGDPLDTSGIVLTKSMWAGTIPDTFISTQRHLIIQLKDGYSFFRNNERMVALRNRLADRTKQTTILLLHPEYSGINAVADMDPQKRGNSGLQKEQCRDATRRMQRLRDEIRTLYNFDIADEGGNRLIGYRNVPTWNGMIGDNRSFVSFYTTHSHRGELLTVEFRNKLSSGEPSPWFLRYSTDADELIRSMTEQFDDWNLWNYTLEARNALIK